MGCSVSTGYVVGGAAPTPSSGDCVVVAPGKIQLFTPDTIVGTVYSPTFTLQPGIAALIDAYNMVDDLHIYVERLVRSSYCPPFGCNCDPVAMHNVAGADGAVSFVANMTLGGGHWSLVKHADGSTEADRLQLLIAVPGVYRLRLEDTDQQLGLLEVEAQMFRLTDVGHLPDVYFAGVL